jgi:hypothetical protein
MMTKLPMKFPLKAALREDHARNDAMRQMESA